MMQPERRQYERKTLNPLPYINLPSENGGIVLDISEQGLRFHALAPVEDSGPITFWFAAHSDLIAGTGEIVWMDQAKKMGGMRFTQIPDRALEQIRSWPDNADLRTGVSEDLTLYIAAPQPEPPAGGSVGAILTAVTSRIAANFRSIGARALGSWLPSLRNSISKLRELVPEIYLRRNHRWLFKTSVALFLGIIVPTAVYIGHRQAGSLLIRLGTKLGGEVNTVMPASAVVASQPNTKAAAPVAEPQPTAPSAQAVPPPASATPDTSAQQIPEERPAPAVRQATVREVKAGVTRTGLVVQVAALREVVEARKLSNKLKQENFQAFVGTLPVDSFYRVMLGPYANAEDARAMLDKLKRAGFNSFIRRGSGAERVGS